MHYGLPDVVGPLHPQDAEFQVFQLCAGLKRHGHAVTSKEPLIRVNVP